MSIDSNLRKHLPWDTFTQIKASVQTNRLFNGVTYQSPQGKVWNIRMAWDKNVSDDITGVFIRIHSADQFYALWSTGDGKSFQSRAIHYMQPTLTEVDKDDKGQAYTFLNQALKGITVDSQSSVPKISLDCYGAIKASKFFSNKKSAAAFDVDHPLIPPRVEDKAPTGASAKGPKAQQPNKEDTSSHMKWALPVCLVIGLFLLVKIVRRSKSSQPPVDIQPLKSAGTGAVI